MKNSTQTITVEQFLKVHSSNLKTVIIDVRTAAEFASEYFDGSIHLPLQDLSPDSFKSCIDNLSLESTDPVYLLCGSGIRANKAAQLLCSSGNNPLVIIEGGINAMKNTDANIKKGTHSVISLDRQVRIAAGSLTLLGVVLGGAVDPTFYILSGGIGAGLAFSGITDTCAMAMIIAKMPWNLVSNK